MGELNVLIADDVVNVRKFISSAIANNFPNVKISSVANGNEAKSKLESNHYDLVLCDQGLSHICGIDLLKWLKSHQTLSKVPFIMLSSDSNQDSVIQAHELGAKAYILKPLTIDKLISKVDIYLNKYNRRQYERFNPSGEVHFSFNSHNCKGKLLDLSAGGLLGLFNITDPLPQIGGEVMIALNLEQTYHIENMYGFILRIQLAEASITSQHVKIALKFIHEKTPDKQTELENILFSLNS